MSRKGMQTRGLLFRADHFPFDVLLIVWSSTCGAKAVHVVLDIVVTKLAHLDTTRLVGLRDTHHVQKSGHGYIRATGIKLT